MSDAPSEKTHELQTERESERETHSHFSQLAGFGMKRELKTL